MRIDQDEDGDLILECTMFELGWLTNLARRHDDRSAIRRLLDRLRSCSEPQEEHNKLAEAITAARREAFGEPTGLLRVPRSQVGALQVLLRESPRYDHTSSGEPRLPAEAMVSAITASDLNQSSAVVDTRRIESEFHAWNASTWDQDRWGLLVHPISKRKMVILRWLLRFLRVGSAVHTMDPRRHEVVAVDLIDARVLRAALATGDEPQLIELPRTFEPAAVTPDEARLQAQWIVEILDEFIEHADHIPVDDDDES